MEVVPRYYLSSYKIYRNTYKLFGHELFLVESFGNTLLQNPDNSLHKTYV